MLPLARFQSAGILGAVINAVELENPNNELGSAEDNAHLAVSLLMVVTSLAFLVPAHVSLNLGRLWHAAVFAVMALVCSSYHVCDTELMQALNGGSGCPGPLRHGLTLADHGMAYFCILQLAFLVLGPEDPVMQWIEHPVVRDTPACALSMSPPWDVIIVTRLLPTVAMGAFLFLYTSWEDFHWQCILLCDVLLLFGCLAFWLHQDRRSAMPKILIRLRFWRRIWNHCVLPMMIASFVFIAMETADSRALHAVWHLIVAALSMSMVKAISNHNQDAPKLEGQQFEEVFDVSPRNPIVARIHLGGVALFGLPTVLACLALDCWAVGGWRWPMVTMPTLQRPGGYVAAIGALPTLLAMTAAFWLIGSTNLPTHHDPEEILASKQLGCHIGYAAVVCGFLTVVAHGGLFPLVHLVCLVTCLILLLLAMMLTTFSVRYPLAPGNRLRCALTFTTSLVLTSFIMLLILTSCGYSIPHPMLAVSEYAALVLPTLWPLTWSAEVQVRWQTHKGFRTVWLNQLA